MAIALVPSLLLDLLIVAAMIYDWRRRGRPHPAWIVGLVVIMVSWCCADRSSETPGWIGFAQSMAHIAG